MNAKLRITWEIKNYLRWRNLWINFRIANCIRNFWPHLFRCFFFRFWVFLKVNIEILVFLKIYTHIIVFLMDFGIFELVPKLRIIYIFFVIFENYQVSFIFEILRIFKTFEMFKFLFVYTQKWKVCPKCISKSFQYLKILSIFELLHFELEFWELLIFCSFFKIFWKI